MTQAAWFCSVSSFLRPVPRCRSVGLGLSSADPMEMHGFPACPNGPRASQGAHATLCHAATPSCAAQSHLPTPQPSQQLLGAAQAVLPSETPAPCSPSKGTGGLSASAPSLLPWPRLLCPVPNLTEAGAAEWEPCQAS